MFSTTSNVYYEAFFKNSYMKAFELRQKIATFYYSKEWESFI